MTMKKCLFLLLLFCGLISGGFSQTFSDADRIRENLGKHVYALANDSMKGRATGSEEEVLFNRYILSQFKRADRGKPVSWKYAYTADSTVIRSEMRGWYVNNHQKRTVLISAHADHIGMGGRLSRSLLADAVHNGADDNASGVALLLELQLALSPCDLPFNLLFVALTGHESGTRGAAFLSEHLSAKYGRLCTVLNFDMIGRMEPSAPVLYVSCSDTLFPVFNAGDTNDFRLVRSDPSRLLILDTRYFVNRGIPCATFTTGMHDDYHKISDDAETINSERLYRIFVWMTRRIPLLPHDEEHRQD